MLQSISLDSFEQSIDEKVLDKGLKYFRSGKVTRLEQLAKDEYAAEIEGTSTYTLSFTLKNRKISDYTCSCPYVDGPVCKHVAAVLFYLMQEELGIKMAVPRKKKEVRLPVKSKKQSPEEKAAALIEQLSAEQLKDIILNIISEDRNFLMKVLDYTAEDTFKEIRQNYKSEIGKIISSQKKQGAIFYGGSRKIGMSLRPIVDQAERAKTQGKIVKAAAISIALVEKIIPTYSFCDDSSAYVSSEADRATEILQAICKETLPEPLRLDILAFCKESYQKKWFQGWDWEITALEIGVKLIKAIPEAEDFLKILDGANTEKYSYAKIILMQSHILFKLKREEEAMELLKDHAQMDAVGLNLLSIYSEDKMFAEAVKLINSNLKIFQAHYPGLVGRWAGYGFQIARDMNDIKLMESYLDLLFKVDFSSAFELKEMIVGQFGETFFKEKLRQSFNQKSGHDYYSKITVMAAEIAKTGTIEELWNLVQAEPGSLMGTYESTLIKHYPTEITEYRLNQLLNKLPHSNGYSSAMEAITTLRKYYKTGDKSKVLECIEFMKIKFSNRPSLMAELKRM